MTLLLASLGSLLGASFDPDYAARRDALVRDASESALKEWETGSDWQKRVTALDVRAWQFEPSLAALAWSVEPTPTRVGLRVADPRVAVPAAVGPLLARIAWGGESSEVRAALVEALARTGGDWSTPALQMWPDETDVTVRGTLVAIARFAPDLPGESLVRMGFGDGDAGVRASALRTVPWLNAPGGLEANVLGTLADPDATVRAEAARAAGMLRIHDAWQPLVKLLSDVDARVRFQAVRSLQRLDAVDAAALPEVDALRHDVDLKVQRAATEMGH